MEDRCKRAETLRPPHDEHCECQFVSDRESSAKSEMNDVEFNGETDDEDMEDGETRFDDGSAPVRNIRDPGQPTESERRDCTNTHRPYRSRCKFWVIGSGVNSSLLEVIWKERRVSMDLDSSARRILKNR